MELLKIIKGEWAVISLAPFSFITLVILAFSAAYFAARWRYTGIVETLKERLHFRADQTEAYKEKASKYDETLATVVDSATPDLKEKTLKLVGDIREFIGRYQRQDAAAMSIQWNTAWNVDEGEKSRKEWSQFTDALMRATEERNSEYNRRFKVEAMILRDELRSRLPNYKSEEFRESAYEHPVNYFGFNDVANDLETMAKSL